MISCVDVLKEKHISMGGKKEKLLICYWKAKLLFIFLGLSVIIIVPGILFMFFYKRMKRKEDCGVKMSTEKKMVKACTMFSRMAKRSSYKTTYSSK